MSTVDDLKQEICAAADQLVKIGIMTKSNVAPVGGEIIQMHAVVYRTRPEFQSVIHTHSPFATGFAVAGKVIPPAYEALVRNGMIEGVPLAGYGPRGSDQSVR